MPRPPRVAGRCRRSSPTSRAPRTTARRGSDRSSSRGPGRSMPAPHRSSATSSARWSSASRRSLARPGAPGVRGSDRPAEDDCRRVPMTDRERAATREERGDSEVHLDRTAFLGVTVSLGLIGGIAAAYGTFLIGIAHHFQLSISTAGLTLSANFAGALLGVVLCWRALGHLSGATVLGLSLLGLAMGLLLAAFAPNWPAFVVGILVSGVGFGAVDFGVVAVVSRTGLEGRAARFSVSGSGWAFGAIAGPLLIVLIRPARFEVFLGVAAF